MTLEIDNKQIDFLFVDDQEIKRAYVDGVQIFDGPVPGDVVQSVLTSRRDVGVRIGYDFNTDLGDLIPKEFRGEAITRVADIETTNEFEIIFLTTTDLGQDFFKFFGVVDLAAIKDTADAIYTFNGTECKWTWPTRIELSIYSDIYDVLFYEKEPFENIEDYNLLPGRSVGGTIIGFTSIKYTTSPYGDLFPAFFKSSGIASIRDLDSDNRFRFDLEDVQLPRDYWREIQITGPGVDKTYYSVDATYIQDSNSTGWSFNNNKAGLITGLIYNVRIRGKQEILYKTDHVLNANSQEDGGKVFKGFSVLNQLNFGSMTNISMKGHNITSVMDEAEFRFVVTVGTVNLPQGYWHTVRIQPGDVILKSSDFLFNNISDDPSLGTNVWTHSFFGVGFVPGQTYNIEFIMDNTEVPRIRGERYQYETQAVEEDSVVNLSIQGEEFRDSTIENIVLYKGSNAFAIVINGSDKLRTYWTELHIPELDYILKSENTIYDRTLTKGKLIWYTLDNLPVLEDGQVYTVYLYS